MPYSPGLHQQTKQSQSLKQTQRLIMSPKMQQAILLLQVPILELAALIETELEQNPILEYEEDGKQSEDPELQRLEESVEEKKSEDEENPDREVSFDDDDFEVLKQLNDEYYDHFNLAEPPRPLSRDSEEEKLKLFQESSITSNESLYEHLMKQVLETFDTQELQKAAQLLIGNFDHNGFLTTHIEEIAHTHNIDVDTLNTTLKTIQTFDPSGVGACNLQESLLLQLKQRGKEQTLAYAIVANHYDDLLHNKMRAITKGLRCSVDEIKAAVDTDIVLLDLHPGLEYTREWVQQIVPDLSIHEGSNGELVVTIHDDRVPSLRLNNKYMRLLQDESLPLETREFLKQKILSAKWLLRNLYQRNETLEKIATSLAKRQRLFFSEPNGTLVPMTMKMVAEELKLHESTIARAVANKYVDSDRGLIALRSLFTNAYNTDSGQEISSKTVRELLKQIIDSEDKSSPLSDQAISEKMKKEGIPCARRTIAKYRREMQFGNAQQRRRYNS